MLRYIPISILIHIIVLFSLGTLFYKATPQGENNTTIIKVININVSKFEIPTQKENKTKETYSTPSIANENIQEKAPEENESTQSDNEEIGSPKGDITPPTPLYTPKINYPYPARVKGIEGTVILRIKISTNGDVIEAKIIQSSGNELLDENSINFVKKIKFIPAKDRNNNPIPLEVDYKIHYILR
jgi:protein TonB